MLTKAQQIVMDFWVLDDAKLLNILLDGTGLEVHERVDKFGCANEHTHTFQARYCERAYQSCRLSKAIKPVLLAHAVTAPLCV